MTSGFFAGHLLVISNAERSDMGCAVSWLGAYSQNAAGICVLSIYAGSCNISSPFATLFP